MATPLWFEHNKEKLKSVEGMTWIQPVEIAEIMLEMIESKEYKSGQVMEAGGRGKNRLVGIYNDPGPPGVGKAQGPNMESEQATFRIIDQEKLKKE